MNLQSRYDLKRAERAIGPLLARTIRPRAPRPPDEAAA
jgi:plasmid maintenance system antidote protein VapI